ncbi:hypothetical protein C8R45DRAFT_420542 [Mycena sanguinolenta]|nr:hypothetical protein C8R45DRAFT_420542 [Mycena sanguinolenta]
MTSGAVLPPELGREIFETTAIFHPETMPLLLRVARRVHFSIEPLSFRAIRVNRKNQSILLAALKAKPPDFIHNTFRHFALETRLRGAPRAKQLLELCTGIIDFRGFTDRECLPFFAKMRLQRLAVPLAQLFGQGDINISHSLFATITHLEMLGNTDVIHVLRNVPQLPVLTHLRLDSDISRGNALRVLVDYPRLQLLMLRYILFDSDRYPLAQIPHKYDVRFVIALCRDPWRDWEEGPEDCRIHGYTEMILCCGNERERSNVHATG